MNKSLTTLLLSRQGPQVTANSPNRSSLWLGLSVAALGALVWSYWPVAWALYREWQLDENYSVGQLVPLAAVYLAWRDRDALRRVPIQPAWLAGVAVIVLAQLARGVGLLLIFESAERYALVLSIWGVVLMAGGWALFRKLIWLMLFLLLMVPLPGKVHNMVSGPLQSQATGGAVFLLELSGTTVTRQGNVILLNDSVPLAVAEACSGLRMLTAFVVVSAVLAYIVPRPRWQKGTLLALSIPVAIVCNLVRLLVTAQLYVFASSEIAERFFHDFAGLVMMPLAVMLLLGLLWVMNKLVEPEPAGAPTDAGSNRPKSDS